MTSDKYNNYERKDKNKEINEKQINTENIKKII